jgi:hypothetical protein
LEGGGAFAASGVVEGSDSARERGSGAQIEGEVAGDEDVVVVVVLVVELLD